MVGEIGGEISMRCGFVVVVEVGLLWVFVCFFLSFFDCVCVRSLWLWVVVVVVVMAGGFYS